MSVKFKKNVLISVEDETAVEDFGQLINSGWNIISTGKTAARLKLLGIPCKPVDDSRFTEIILNGQMKILDSNILVGIIANRERLGDMEDLETYGIMPIDMVVMNLPDFKKAPGFKNIDICGPALIRAAAQNGASVTVVTDPNDYAQVIKELLNEGQVREWTREYLAIKAFEHTSSYDSSIVRWAKKQSLLGCLFYEEMDFC